MPTLGKVARRGFLRGLLASPFAAKATAEQLAGASIEPSKPFTGMPHTMDGPINEAATNTKREVARKAIAKLFNKSGLPKWKREELRREATFNNPRIHPDIGCLRSTSLSHKFRMQADRNYISMERDLLDHFSIKKSLGDHRAEFEKKYGWYL